MAYQYAVQVYTGHTPKNIKSYTKDWILLSKAKSLETGKTKAKKLSSTYTGRIYRVVRLDNYGYTLDYHKAYEFCYFTGGFVDTRYTVSENVSGVKTAYERMNEKFVKENSRIKPKYVLFPVNVNFNKATFEEYFDFYSPDKLEDAYYVGSFLSDINQQIEDNYSKYYVCYLDKGAEYERSFYRKNASGSATAIPLSEIYEVHKSNLIAGINKNYQLNQVVTTDITNSNLRHDLNTLNSYFLDRTLSGFRQKIFNMMSYFSLMFEVNKENTAFDCSILEEFSNDFNSCVPDLLDGLDKMKVNVDRELEELEEKIKNAK